MAGGAPLHGQPFIVVATGDAEKMWMTVVSLPWELGCRVAIEAARTLQDRGDATEDVSGILQTHGLLCFARLEV
jgi:hypothetical protein